ncbi:hypothetical protein ACTFR8_23980 [Bacillus cereus group sp. MYBK15-3]|uniref:hypothetical protein n=1 Tax=Bacillus cereus group TaxID=86661 RepID=UPI001C8B4B91|nr:hypothetical protein [Bacillus cereus]MBX9158659.1 hypothetical protein [Bacillus cereus]
MNLRGFWVNSAERIAVFRVTEDGEIYYRRVDKLGKPIDRKMNRVLAGDKLPSFVKEGSGHTYKE